MVVALEYSRNMTCLTSCSSVLLHSLHVLITSGLAQRVASIASVEEEFVLS